MPTCPIHEAQGLICLKQVGGGSVGVEPVVLWGLLSYMRLESLILWYSYEAEQGLMLHIFVHKGHGSHGPLVASLNSLPACRLQL